jgi:class 3 adenylate cyclase
VPLTRIVQVGGDERDHVTLHTILREGRTPSEFSAVAPADAIAALNEFRVDLLLVDVRQPSNDVLALMKTARTANGRGGAIPVMVVAPVEMQDRIQACLSRGADDFLTSPFDERYPLLVTSRIDACLMRHPIRASGGLSEAAATTLVIPQAGVAAGVAAADAASADAAMLNDMKTVHRFIPREFLDFLERGSLADVRLGDHVLREMTIFFSDIRDFTRLSERLTPAENFNFLTSYLKNVTPIIRENGGFVDKYLGDGVMALFPGEASHAVAASVAMLAQLERYNLGRVAAGYVPIKIGMGLHRGSLMLGTIGAEDQMQTTVIADAVNLASRIEGMTKTFGANLLLSGSVVDVLPADHKFKLRPLGAVKAKGKTQSVEIYECFDNDSRVLIEHKEKTAPQFAIAMAEFRKGMFLTAGRIFSRIAELNSDDAPAAFYRDRCSLTVVRDRGGERWDGAEYIDVK